MLLGPVDDLLSAVVNGELSSGEEAKFLGAKFQTSFYADAIDALFKALGAN